MDKNSAFVTLEASRTIDIPGHGTPDVTWPTNYFFGEPGVATRGPQAFRVTREPHRESRAHFHHVDQFQVFFGASDTVFQRHKTGPLLIHYSDSDTLYGPFSSGDEPFVFMTLRPHGNTFKGFMPDHKAEMAHTGTKRHYHNDLRDWLDVPYPEDGGSEIESILEPQADNLAAFKITAALGAKFATPNPAGSGGQYHVVVQGEALLDGQALPLHSIGWVGASDDSPVLVAGESGARLVVLQFGSANA
ncbi:MAG: hypothetical protein JWM85_220 [Acidimicrobiaceae bacterium]|nr:hypothetical protein [Acidimicrobiaceae bacterium]